MYVCMYICMYVYMYVCIGMEVCMLVYNSTAREKWLAGDRLHIIFVIPITQCLRFHPWICQMENGKTSFYISDNMGISFWPIPISVMVRKIGINLLN